MKVLDCYIARAVLQPMLATIVITLVLLLAERSLSVIDLVIGWQGGFAVIFELLGYLVPHYMGLALPAAFFLGVLLAFGRLSREAELDAMGSGGYGLASALRPLMAIALVVTILHLILVSHIQPYSRYAYRAALHTVTSVSFQSLIQPRRFVTLGDTTYFVEAVSEDRDAFGGVFLFSTDAGRGEVVVTAKSGRLTADGPFEPLHLELFDGVQQLLPPGSSLQTPPLTVRFRNFVTDMSGHTPEAFRPRGEDERELTMPELWRMRGSDHGTIEAHEISAELSGRLVGSLSIMALPFLGLPLALSRRRSQAQYGLFVGITVLVGYNQWVRTGEALVDDGVIGAALGLWLPFLTFLTATTIYFQRTASRVPHVSVDNPLERLLDGVLQRMRRTSRLLQKE